MHKSQGFGFEAWRGNYPNYFLYMDGVDASANLFENIETSWSRISGTGKISELLPSDHNHFAFSIAVNFPEDLLLPDLLSIGIFFESLMLSLLI